MNIYNYLTISSLTNSYFGLNGAFDGVYEITGAIRDFVGASIKGGRVHVNEKYDKKIINNKISNFDGVSLYASSIYRLCNEYGLPLGKAQKIKDFNKDVGVQPVILIVPKYGRNSALKILSTLSYYFFPYKNVGWKGSSPSYFNKVDDLLYYTNGSIDLKKYIKHLLKTGNELVSPVSNDFTKIKLENNSNDIEYKLPK